MHSCSVLVLLFSDFYSMQNVFGVSLQVSFLNCMSPTLMIFFILFYPNLCFLQKYPYVVSCGKLKNGQIGQIIN